MAKKDKVKVETYEQRLMEMESTLKALGPQVREFDEDLVRRLFNRQVH